jgi:hypothetical protein
MTTPARRALRDLTTALLAHTDTHIPRDEASRSVSTATLAVQIVDHQRCEFANLASGIIAELPDPESGRARLWQKDGGWWCPITEEAYQHAVDACDSLACGRCASCVAEDAADQEAVQGLRRLTFTLDQVVGQLRQLADDAKTSWPRRPASTRRPTPSTAPCSCCTTSAPACSTWSTWSRPTAAT